MSNNHYFPGKKFRLPEFGSNSVAALWKRFVALVIDWGLATLISYGFFAYDPLWLLFFFVVPRMFFQILIGASIGQLFLGIRLTRVDGKALGIWAPIIRTLLLILVIPAIVLDPDQRGIHDVVAKTLVVQR